jgi:pimeloyl-ACP methyl ester carboxylesterase
MAMPLRYFAVAPLFAIPFPRFVLRSLLLGRQANLSLIQSAQRAIRRVPAKVLATRTQEIFRTDERTALRTLGKPVLYLRGSQDLLISEKCWKSLKKVRPDASVIHIKGPHMLLQTSPRECWDAILLFFGHT